MKGRMQGLGHGVYLGHISYANAGGDAKEGVKLTGEGGVEGGGYGVLSF